MLKWIANLRYWYTHLPTLIWLEMAEIFIYLFSFAVLSRYLTTSPFLAYHAFFCVSYGQAFQA